MNFENIKKFILSIYNAYYREKAYQRYRKNVKILNLSNAQKKEIKSYYKDNYGVSVTTKFHQLLYSISGVYKKEFMPLDVIAHVEETLSPFKYAKVLDDKAMYDWSFPGILFPERIAISCNGVPYCRDINGTVKEIR